CGSTARSATTCRKPSPCCARPTSTCRCSSRTSVTDPVMDDPRGDGPAGPDEATALADTRQWLEKAVIGLNLCPFAKAVYVKEQVRLVFSDATTPEQLVEQLGEELLRLRDTPAEQI